jgi:hypothetical protein
MNSSPAMAEAPPAKALVNSGCSAAEAISASHGSLKATVTSPDRDKRASAWSPEKLKFTRLRNGSLRQALP